MNETLNERLSALVDGELSGIEADGLLSALKEDAELRARWQRYQLISQAMKRDLGADLKHDLANRVSDALKSEPTVLAPPRKRTGDKGLARQLAGFAIAASITAVAILGVQSLTTDVQPVGPQVAQAPSAPVDAEWIRASDPRPGDVATPLARPSLNPYLVNHNEHASSAAMRGLLPYAKIVSSDSLRGERAPR